MCRNTYFITCSVSDRDEEYTLCIEVDLKSAGGKIVHDIILLGISKELWEKYNVMANIRDIKIRYISLLNSINYKWY